MSKNGTKNTGNISGVTQTLITFLPVGFTTWQRNLYDTWGAWVKVPSREEFESLKSSVSDGKTAIAAAITGKGVTASGSDTHQQLAMKINQIQMGKKFANGTANVNSNGYFDITGLLFEPGAVNFEMSTVVGRGGARRYDSVGGSSSSQSEGFIIMEVHSHVLQI